MRSLEQTPDSTPVEADQTLGCNLETLNKPAFNKPAFYIILVSLIFLAACSKKKIEDVLPHITEEERAAAKENGEIVGVHGELPEFSQLPRWAQREIKKHLQDTYRPLEIQKIEIEELKKLESLLEKLATIYKTAIQKIEQEESVEVLQNQSISVDMSVPLSPFHQEGTQKILNSTGNIPIRRGGRKVDNNLSSELAENPDDWNDGLQKIQEYLKKVQRYRETIEKKMHSEQETLILEEGKLCITTCYGLAFPLWIEIYDYEKAAQLQFGALGQQSNLAAWNTVQGMISPFQKFLQKQGVIPNTSDSQNRPEIQKPTFEFLRVVLQVIKNGDFANGPMDSYSVPGTHGKEHIFVSKYPHIVSQTDMEAAKSFLQYLEEYLGEKDINFLAVQSLSEKDLKDFLSKVFRAYKKHVQQQKAVTGTLPIPDSTKKKDDQFKNTPLPSLGQDTGNIFLKRRR